MVGVVSLNLSEITRSSLAIPSECFASTATRSSATGGW